MNRTAYRIAYLANARRDRAARRDYEFRLESAFADRCATCIDFAGKRADGINCRKLHIAIADAKTSRCPLYTEVPF